MLIPPPYIARHQEAAYCGPGGGACRLLPQFAIKAEGTGCLEQVAATCYAQQTYTRRKYLENMFMSRGCPSSTGARPDRGCKIASCSCLNASACTGVDKQTGERFDKSL